MLIHPLCVVWRWHCCGNMWLWLVALALEIVALVLATALRVVALALALGVVVLALALALTLVALLTSLVVTCLDKSYLSVNIRLSYIVACCYRQLCTVLRCG